MPTHDPLTEGLPVLDTPRLRLRPPSPDDADAVLSIFGDPIAMRYWSSLPMQSRDEAVAFLAGLGGALRDRTVLKWAIALDPHGPLVGTVTLHAWSRDNRRAEIGYMLAPAHQGRGLATEAVSAVLDFAFDRLDLHRVEADVHPENAASIRLLERLGFAREGLLAERWFVGEVWSDSLLYGLLRRNRPSASTEG